MASSMRWVPMGGDGADAIPTDNRDIMLAIDAFKELALTIEHDDAPAGQVRWQSFVDKLPDNVSPYGLFVTVGIIYNAAIFRVLAGDPEPSAAPGIDLEIQVVGIDAQDGTPVELPLEVFATRAISLAANWEWNTLNNLMLERIEHEDDVDEFLYNLGACLMSIFIGVGGSEAAGWRT